MNALMSFAAAARLMQRVLQQHVRRGDLVDDRRDCTVLPQKSVNQRPTMALLSSSFDMIKFLEWLGLKRSGIAALSLNLIPMH